MPFPRSAALDESTFPSRLLTSALGLTTFTFGWLGWLIVDLRRNAQVVRSAPSSSREHR